MAVYIAVNDLQSLYRRNMLTLNLELFWLQLYVPRGYILLDSHWRIALQIFHCCILNLFSHFTVSVFGFLVDRRRWPLRQLTAVRRNNGESYGEHIFRSSWRAIISRESSCAFSRGYHQPWNFHGAHHFGKPRRRNGTVAQPLPARKKITTSKRSGHVGRILCGPGIVVLVTVVRHNGELFPVDHRMHKRGAGTGRFHLLCY